MEATSHNKYVSLLRIKIERLRQYCREQMDMGKKLHELQQERNTLFLLEKRFIDSMRQREN